MITEQEIIIQQAVDWLEAEIKSRGIAAKVCRDQIEERRREYHTFIGIPVRVQEESLDAYDEAALLVEMENAWNYREPKPAKLLALLPAGLPQGVW